jgi:divalent metal cation (Fe/Co/Zn/Cd) transporter
MPSFSLLRRGLWLEYATLGWNIVGTAIVLVAAVGAGSAALAGFGLDSAIEIFASVVVVWQLKGTEQGRESLALKLIGTAFIALAIYVLVQCAYTLLAAAHPAPSPLGILWLAVTCAVMLLLAWGKSVTGRQLGNLVLTTEARVTLIDAALAGAVLVGIGLNALFGWWWADPVAGLVIVYYGLTEGRAAWKHAADPTVAQTDLSGIPIDGRNGAA